MLPVIEQPASCLAGFCFSVVPFVFLFIIFLSGQMTALCMSSVFFLFLCLVSDVMKEMC